MRVLVDARVGWGSGIGRVVASTVPGVARLRPDCRFDLLVPPDDVASAKEAVAGLGNCAVLACNIVPFTLREQVALNRLARGYDLTWFTNYWVPLGWRGRFVVTVYDLLHLEPELFPASKAKRLLSRLTFRKVARRAAAVMFISRFTERAFVARFGRPTVGVVVHLGADHLGGVDPAAFTLAGKARSVLVVAASKQHKNFDLVLAAWQAARLPEGWRLTIVTPDDRLRSSIDLPGYVAATPGTELRRGISNADLAALYTQASIVLVPSLYEGFGLPLVEAMRAGALCVSSTADALVEIAGGAFALFAHGRDLPGWVDGIETACRLFESGDVDMEAMLRHNMARMGQFRWSKTAEEMAAVIGGVVDGVPRKDAAIVRA
jgi:glycosyltransferase involved in cell wall biosynthesis